MAAEQEPIEQGAERLVLGQVVRRREEREQGKPVDLGAAAIDPLVQHRQQVVQDRAVGVEQLVEEDELGLGEHAGDDRGDRSLAEPGQVDRAEDLVRLGEARQQVFEGTPPHHRRELVDQRRLGRPRRPMQEQVLARDDRQRDEVDHLVAADEAALEHVDDVLPECGHRLLNHGRSRLLHGGRDQLDVLERPPLRTPGRCRRFALRESLGVEQHQSLVPAEVERRRRPLVQTGEHARQRPLPQHPLDQADQRVGRVERPGAAMDLGQVAQQEVGRQMIRRRGRRPRHPQTPLQVLHAIVMADERPARLPDHLRRRAGEACVERDRRAGDVEPVRGIRPLEEAGHLRGRQGRGLGRSTEVDSPLLEEVREEFITIIHMFTRLR